MKGEGEMNHKQRCGARGPTPADWPLVSRGPRCNRPAGHIADGLELHREYDKGGAVLAEWTEAETLEERRSRRSHTFLAALAVGALCTLGGALPASAHPVRSYGPAALHFPAPPAGAPSYCLANFPAPGADVLEGAPVPYYHVATSCYWAYIIGQVLPGVVVTQVYS